MRFDIEDGLFTNEPYGNSPGDSVLTARNAPIDSRTGARRDFGKDLAYNLAVLSSGNRYYHGNKELAERGAPRVEKIMDALELIASAQGHDIDSQDYRKLGDVVAWDDRKPLAFGSISDLEGYGTNRVDEAALRKALTILGLGYGGDERGTSAYSSIKKQFKDLGIDAR